MNRHWVVFLSIFIILGTESSAIARDPPKTQRSNRLQRSTQPLNLTQPLNGKAAEAATQEEESKGPKTSYLALQGIQKFQVLNLLKQGLLEDLPTGTVLFEKLLSREQIVLEIRSTLEPEDVVLIISGDRFSHVVASVSPLEENTISVRIR